jgi:hypothetical protein
MITSNRIFRMVLALVLSAGMLVSSPHSIVRAAESADKVSVSLIGKYDSADTAAIRDIDTTKKIIRFRNHQTGKTYTLSYDNTSMMYDARGTVLSASLLEVGEIVDVTFLKSSKHITTLNVSSDAWVVENTRNHDLVRGDGTARILGDTYKIDARTLVIAEGELALAEDVLSTDKITVSGIGKDIYSVVVTSGHGYVSLSSDTVEDHSLVGAWLELDNEVIHKISPNMMLSAPEGDYNLQILGNGASYQTEVNISRNQETVVDTSSVTISKPKESLVTFEIIPEDAEVFVDGQRVLTGTPQSINYGYHSLKVLADGYITQDKYLKVGTAKAVIQIELEKEDDSAADTSSSAETVNGTTAASSASTYASYPVGTIDFGASSSAASSAATVSANSSDSESANTNKLIKGYYIYFDKPYGAEVYFDGAYVGVVPTSVNKISGNHEIILKQDGYETKSYRINVDKEEDNKSYSFPDLIKIKKDDDSSSSSSVSTGDSSSSSDSSSTDDSSDSGDSASTGDSSSPADASTTEDSAPASDSSSADDSASTEDTSGAGDSSSTDSSGKEEASESASEDASTNEGASDAANTASGEG